MLVQFQLRFAHFVDEKLSEGFPILVRERGKIAECSLIVDHFIPSVIRIAVDNSVEVGKSPTNGFGHIGQRPALFVVDKEYNAIAVCCVMDDTHSCYRVRGGRRS